MSKTDLTSYILIRVALPSFPLSVLVFKQHERSGLEVKVAERARFGRGGNGTLGARYILVFFVKELKR